MGEEKTRMLEELQKVVEEVYGSGKIFAAAGSSRPLLSVAIILDETAPKEAREIALLKVRRHFSGAGMQLCGKIYYTVNGAYEMINRENIAKYLQRRDWYSDYRILLPPEGETKEHGKYNNLRFYLQ